MPLNIVFFLIWRGWGLIVPIGFLVSFVVLLVVRPMLHVTALAAAPFLGTTAGLITALACFLIIRTVEKPWVRIDPVTGHRSEVRHSAGSFVYVPLRFWIFIMPVLGALFSWVYLLDEQDLAAKAAAEAAAPPAAASAQPAASDPFAGMPKGEVTVLKAEEISPEAMHREHGRPQDRKR